MLVDELGGAVAAQQQREGVEPGDHALQLDPFDQEDRNGQLRAPDAVQEVILEAQRSPGHPTANQDKP